MKSKMLFTVLLYSLLIFFNIPLATAETETQTEKEIAQIQSADAEYEQKHPRPKDSPKPLKSFMEISTDDKSMKIGTHAFEEQAVVYMEKDSDTYHTGNCSYYAKKSNKDYSRPRWLSNVVIDAVRCTLCVDDDLYYTYKEAVYRTEINDLSESNLAKKVQKQENNIKILIILCFTQLICLVAVIIKLLKNNSYTKRLL